MSEWIFTDNIDDNYAQYVKKIDVNCYKVVEYVKYCIEDGHEVESFTAYDTFIDLNNYTEQEILEELKAYGYEERQDPQIEAECIAEQNMDVAFTTDRFDDILEWLQKLGIDTER